MQPEEKETELRKVAVTQKDPEKVDHEVTKGRTVSINLQSL